MATETKPDLHGITGQPFPDFNEGVSYLERVTISVYVQAALRAAYNEATGHSFSLPDEPPPRGDKHAE